jgi:peptidoglycan-N-acetylglucosamine deacetylase
MASFLAFLAVAVSCCCLAYFYPYLLRIFAVRSLRRRVQSDRSLALTYDDGPSGRVTPELLSLLRNYNVKATFFVIGQHAVQQENVIRQLIEEGHELGCHTDRHFNAWKVGPRTGVADINAGYERLSAWIPANGMFRPPFGKVTLPTFWSVRRRGAPFGWWTIDSRDSHGPLPQPHEIVDRLEREGGGVVLMHDLDRDADRNAFVLETTKRLLELARRKSFKVVRLGELLT